MGCMPEGGAGGIGIEGGPPAAPDWPICGGMLGGRGGNDGGGRPRFTGGGIMAPICGMPPGAPGGGGGGISGTEAVAEGGASANS